MKIGIMIDIYDKAYGRFGDDKYKKLREHGFSCIDFNMAHTDTPIYNLPENESDEILLKERKLMENAGIEVSQVHGPWRWPANDFSDEDRKERMEKMKKSIRMTSVIGCKNWVIHPIMPFGIEDMKTGDEEKTWNMNVEFMTELVKTAKEYGITVCFENMPMVNFSLGSPEQILNFVKTINDENFKICLDTGHVSVYNNLSVGEEVRRLGDYIKVFHIHDNMFGNDLHLPPRFGIIDWEDFSKSIKDINFNGCFSLETVPPETLPTDIFEQMCINYAKIAEDIIKTIENK